MADSPSLRSRLLDAFENTDAALQRVQALRGRPVVVFGPGSSLGLLLLPSLMKAGANIVLAVDDYERQPALHGVPVCSVAAFLARARRMRDAVLVDFSAQPHARAVCMQLVAQSGLREHDLLELLAAYDNFGVYEPVAVMRQRTLDRAGDWLVLADRLADDFSRETLYAILLQRLDFRRDWVRPLNIGLRDEYFGLGARSDTFHLGTREHFIDCGAHRGTVVQRLLAATRCRYASIHAFEPDAQNLVALERCMVGEAPNFHVHGHAVSDRREVLRFLQTGTMGSHCSDEGNVDVQAVALDDSLERATFIKMDLEGGEARGLRGASRLLSEQRPRLAIAAYHYAHDLLEIAQVIDDTVPGYVMRLRHQSEYFYDTILYASPREDWMPVEAAR